MVDRTRHQDLFDASDWTVTLIGLGGIGAITGLTLGKMGVAGLIAVDDDEVSEENIATQFYPCSCAGTRKVDEFLSQFKEYADDVMISGLVGRLEPGWEPEMVWRSHTDISSHIIISAVDSITSRQKIWEALGNFDWVYYIDARMAAEELLIYTVDARDPLWYGEMLAATNEDDIPDLPCTAKATFYTGAGAAAYIGALVRKIVANQTPPKVLAVSFKELSSLVV